MVTVMMTVMVIAFETFFAVFYSCALLNVQLQVGVLLVRTNLGGNHNHAEGENDNDDDNDDNADEDDGEDANLLSKIQCREDEEKKKLPKKQRHHCFNLSLCR